MNGEAKNMNESWWGESLAPDGERGWGPAVLLLTLVTHWNKRGSLKNAGVWLPESLIWSEALALRVMLRYPEV